jgi:hypothetical protein
MVEQGRSAGAWALRLVLVAGLIAWSSYVLTALLGLPEAVLIDGDRVQKTGVVACMLALALAAFTAGLLLWRGTPRLWNLVPVLAPLILLIGLGPYGQAREAAADGTGGTEVVDLLRIAAAGLVAMMAMAIGFLWRKGRPLHERFTIDGESPPVVLEDRVQSLYDERGEPVPPERLAP